jgi:ATP-dependent Clp protease protease subunit
MKTNINLDSLAKSLRSYEIGKLPLDPENPFLQRRTIFLSGGINFSVAQTVSEQLLHLDSQPSFEPIKLLINSYGGDYTACMAIRNTMRSINTPVDTINTGFCASSAFILHQSATGKRYACKGSAFLIHEGKGKPQKLVQISINDQEELIRTRCNVPADWLPVGRRNFTFSAEDALKYKVVDEVITKINF